MGGGVAVGSGVLVGLRVGVGIGVEVGSAVAVGERVVAVVAVGVGSGWRVAVGVLWLQPMQMTQADAMEHALNHFYISNSFPKVVPSLVASISPCQRGVR